MSIPHFLSKGGAVDTITAFNPDSDRPVVTADSRHPHWSAILDGIARGDSNVFELFDVAGGVMSRFRQLTDRVSYDGTNILFDGDVVHSTLANQVQRALESGEDDYAPLVKFWEKLESNPNEHSREQAYNWLASHEFMITPEGDVVGYKGVSQDSEGNFVSGWSSGVPDKPSAFVDGQPVAPLSVVPNKVGSVVSMPRSEVVHDPSQACRRGLHVSTRSYAESYASSGAVLEVHVNPRDIVSVPTDGAGAKVRACRYKVARVALDAYDTSGPVLRDNPANVWAGDVGYSPR